MPNLNRKGTKGKRCAKSDRNSSRQDPRCNSSIRLQVSCNDENHHKNRLSSCVGEAESTIGRAQLTPVDHWIPGGMEQERTLQLLNNSFVTGRFTELQLERNYLLDSLQKADEQATRLVRLLAQSRAKLYQSPVHDRSISRSKRQCNKFKQRLRECENEEKAVLNNLGRVSWQIQATERWMNAEQYSLRKASLRERTRFSELSHDVRIMTLDPCSPAFQPQTWHGVYQSGPWIPEQEGAQIRASNWISPTYSSFYNSAYDHSNYHNHFYGHGTPVEAVYQPVLAAFKEDKTSAEAVEVETDLRRTSETYLDLLDKNNHPLERVRTNSLPVGSDNDNRCNEQSPVNSGYQGYGILGERTSRGSA